MKYWMNLWLCLLLSGSLLAQAPSAEQIASWKAQASRVQIIRDGWGIPHIYGKSDADAVFGLLYAQCEDDFARVEANYIEKLGRKAEAFGPAHVYEDLQVKMLLDSADARKDFVAAPEWLRRLCIAFADGINFYLHTHPEVKPLLLHDFEPWWPMLWTDGSIGAISTGGASLAELRAFYERRETAAATIIPLGDDNQIGSNGFAFGPRLTADGNPILVINPHVTFYFRPEVHMVSEEGLNAYGAVTWGQFFVYQGFNPFCGWMHTSSRADVADLYREDVQQKGNEYTYLLDGRRYAFKEKMITVKTGSNAAAAQSFKVYQNDHGPVVAARNGSWLTLKHHNRSMRSLMQSWMRTKAGSFQAFKEVMYLKENTSNNTVYADRDGNIAYWHGNFMPRRNQQYDYRLPVDGTTSATDWKGVHMVDDMVHVYNPTSGWIQNCNSTPATAAGASSPVLARYPAYMAPDENNFRGVTAVRQCLNLMPRQLTVDKAAAVAYTRFLPAFEYLIPTLLQAKPNEPEMAEALDTLRKWTYESHSDSRATALAIEWGERLLPAIAATKSTIMNDTGFVGKLISFSQQATPERLADSLRATMKTLTARYGTWRVTWGEINRYQRLTGNLQEIYSDDSSSIPVPFAAATWGSLPSYVSRRMPETQKRYGYSGNSFVCVVSFGQKIKAKSLLAGGNSSHTSSPHFKDQAGMYASGSFKEVLFYREDVEANAKRTYRPGE